MGFFYACLNLQAGFFISTAGSHLLSSTLSHTLYKALYATRSVQQIILDRLLLLTADVALKHMISHPDHMQHQDLSSASEKRIRHCRAIMTACTARSWRLHYICWRYQASAENTLALATHYANPRMSACAKQLANDSPDRRRKQAGPAHDEKNFLSYPLPNTHRDRRPPFGCIQT